LLEKAIPVLKKQESEKAVCVGEEQKNISWTTKGGERTLRVTTPKVTLRRIRAERVMNLQEDGVYMA